MTMQLPLDFYEISELFFLTIALTVFTRLIIYLLKRTWQKQKCKLVWTPINVVERRSNLLYDEFIKEYASVGKPVIITDVMQNWKALTKWNLDFFKLEYGTVECAVKKDDVEIHSFMTIAEYIDYMISGNSNKRLYLANWVVSCYPELLDDYREPIYFPNWLQRIPRNLLLKYECDNPEIFIGHKNTSVGLHQDPDSFSAWLGLISGRKQIVLFTPDQKDVLYDGKVDIFNPDLEKFPLYAKANPVEVILEPGEVLYIPSQWWHHVNNLETSIGIGNIFINEFNSELVFQSFVESNPIKGHFLPLILDFPWIGKILFSLGII